MELKSFFHNQRLLDEYIERNRLMKIEPAQKTKKKLLALQVELAELANELPTSFKYWANKKNRYDLALEELVDCFHFLLSIGNDFGLAEKPYQPISAHEHLTLHEVFTIFITDAGRLDQTNYVQYMNDFLALIDTLGFNLAEFEAAYYRKAKKNYQRQAEGY